MPKEPSARGQQHNKCNPLTCGDQTKLGDLDNTNITSEPMAPPVPATEEDLRAFGRSLQTYFASQSSEQLSTTYYTLLQNATLLNLSPGHRIAAFNALCGFVDLCSESTDTNIKDIAQDPQNCSAILGIYLQHYENSRAKSMKQLLTCVTKAIARQPPGPGVYTKADSLQNLLTIVCDNDEEARAKPAFHVLSALLHKQLVTAPEILANLRGERLGLGDSTLSTRQLAELLLARLFTWTAQQDVAPIVGSFIPIFVQSFADQSLGNNDKPVWIMPLAQFLQNVPDQLPAFRFHIFPGLFKPDIQGYWQFLQHIGIFKHLGIERRGSVVETEREICTCSTSLVFTVLQIGKELGFLELCDSATCSSILFEERVILICDRLLGHLLGDLDLGIRLSGMSLLISSKQHSLPLTEGALESLEEYIPHSLMEPDANFRSEMLSHIRNLVERIKTACSFLSRIIVQHNKHDRLAEASTTKTIMENHKAFLHWLVGLVSAELHPYASYQRHATALKILFIILQSGLDSNVPENMLSKQARSDLRWGFSISIMDSTVQRLLLDGLMDPFEDVRQSSAAILKAVARSSIHSPQTKQSPADSCKAYLYPSQVARSRAQRTMLLSGRIDHADGYARVSDVYFEHLLVAATGREVGSSPTSKHSADFAALVDLLKDTVAQISAGVKIAGKNLTTAVEQYPIHGLLTSMRYLLENAIQNPSAASLTLQFYPNLCKDLEILLHDIWACVRETLCNDAPEGFLPDEADDESSMTTRDLLSYSWRALKESSLLLRTVIISLEVICDPVDRQRILDSLGGLCFTQLADLRHRGAFSTVAQSFATVCQESQHSPMLKAGSLNLKWYDATFDLIQAQGSKITRRSAGIPAAMVGLLAAGIDFGRAITDLERIALENTSAFDNGQIDLPQVHALNCLRAAFTSTKVVSKSEPHLVKAISIAAGALKSELWPIRNCGLMLLRSLIDRLLGSHEAYDEVFASTTGSRLAYDRYPGLLELLRQLLSPITSDGPRHRESAPESLFPALDLLRRAPPPSEARGGFIPLILVAATSSQWHIREAAARAFAALASGASVPLLDIPNAMKTGSDNMIHGRLLSLKFSIMASIQVLENKAMEADAIRQIAQQLKSISSCWSFKQFWTPILAKTFYDSINLVGTFLLKSHCQHGRPTSISHVSPTISSGSPKSNDESQITAEANEALFQAIFATSTTSSILQGPSVGGASMRACMALARILSLLNRSLTTSPQDLESIIAQIQAELGQQDAESFEDITGYVLRTSSVVDDPSTILHAFSEALAGFICNGTCHGTLELLLTAKNLPSSRPVQNIRIRDVARSALASILAQTNKEQRKSSDACTQALSQLQLDIDCWDSSSPSSIQSLLELWGASLDAKYLFEKSWTQTLLDEGSLWTKWISSALSDLNEFPLRFAAVLSLDGFKQACESSAEIPDPLVISIIFATYTALNDDDEDVRNVAAKVATRLLSRPDTPRPRVVSAAVASNQICELLATQYSELPRVTHEAMERMTGQKFDSSTPESFFISTDANTRLQEYLQEDNTLFAVEKQNLYLDPVREADIWSTVLLRMSPAAIITDAINELSQWALSGLRGLVAVAHSNEDGPLGWTSKPDVFAFGIQVLNASAVLLGWQSRGKDVHQAGEVRTLLNELVRGKDKTLLHELWVQRTEEVLSSSFKEPGP